MRGPNSPFGLERTQVRADVTALLGQITNFGGRIYNMRMPPLRRDMLPCVSVFVPNDTRAAMTAGHHIGDFDGTLTLRLVVVAEDGADPGAADQLDWLCCLVETALLATHRGRAILPAVNGIETSIDLDVQGEMRTATATIDLAVPYAECFEVLHTDQLRNLNVRLDFIDPAADPNTGSPPADVPGGYIGGFPGPDGRIEYQFEVKHAEDLADDRANAGGAPDPQGRAAATAPSSG